MRDGNDLFASVFWIMTEMSDDKRLDDSSILTTPYSLYYTHSYLFVDLIASGDCRCCGTARL